MPWVSSEALSRDVPAKHESRAPVWQPCTASGLGPGCPCRRRGPGGGQGARAQQAFPPPRAEGWRPADGVGPCSCPWRHRAVGLGFSLAEAAAENARMAKSSRMTRLQPPAILNLCVGWQRNGSSRNFPPGETGHGAQWDLQKEKHFLEVSCLILKIQASVHSKP